jgi:hypothetical protein
MTPFPSIRPLDQFVVRFQHATLPIAVPIMTPMAIHSANWCVAVPIATPAPIPVASHVAIVSLSHFDFKKLISLSRRCCCARFDELNFAR